MHRFLNVHHAFALLLLLILVAPPVQVAAQAAPATLSITPATSTARPGERFNLQVLLTSDVPTRGLQLGLKFDPQVVQVDDVSAATFYSDWASMNGGSTTVIPFIADNTQGKVSIGGIAVLGGPELGGPSGAGPVLNLELTARAPQSGQTTLEFTDVVVSTAEARSVPTVSTTGAAIVVDSSAGAAAPQPPVQDFNVEPSGMPAPVHVPPEGPSASAPNWVLVGGLSLLVGLLTYALIVFGQAALARVPLRGLRRRPR
jgi:hypothetical protein